MRKDSFKVGKAQSIPIKDLRPHPLAQRGLDARHVERIAQNFDPALLGEITVARTKKGQLWIVDGQHRVAGALAFLNGDSNQQIACRVIDVDDDAEAASLFLGLNTHKSVGALDRFKVRVVAEDAIALGITSILDRYALRVSVVRAEGTVQAVDACESVFKRDRGALLLDRVIRILNQAWGKDPDAYNGQLVRGLGLLLSKYNGAVDDAELVRKLAKKSGPNGVLGRARDLKIGIGGSMPQAVAEHIRGEYNKGRRTEKLEERAA